MGIKMATDGVLRGLGIMRPFLIANMVNLAIRLSVALIFAPRYGIAFVWLAVPAGWFANFLISYGALRNHGRLMKEFHSGKFLLSFDGKLDLYVKRYIFVTVHWQYPAKRVVVNSNF